MMSGMHSPVRFALLAAVVAACARASTPAPEPPIRADDASVLVAPSVVTATPTPAPSSSGAVGCSSDADCDWDDPCLPERCLALPKRGPTVCDKSYLPPGTCTCFDHACTVRRTGPAPKVAGCKVDADCGFDAGGGACRPGIPAKRIVDEGAACHCAGGSCALEWVDPVACTTTSDCSWLESPRRPAPASKVPRPKPPVKPCVTGEWDSVCFSGRCRINAWKC